MSLYEHIVTILLQLKRSPVDNLEFLLVVICIEKNKRRLQLITITDGPDRKENEYLVTGPTDSRVNSSQTPKTS